MAKETKCDICDHTMSYKRGSYTGSAYGDVGALRSRPTWRARLFRWLIGKVKWRAYGEDKRPTYSPVDVCPGCRQKIAKEVVDAD